MFGKGGERRFRAEIRLIDSGVCAVCVPGFFRGTVFNSQTKLRLGDTTTNQKSMFGKGEERRFRAEIRLEDPGACARVPGFFRGAVFSCGPSIPKRNVDWETPLGIKRICLAKVRSDEFGPKSAWEILVRACPAFFVVLSSLVASQFPNETSIGRHN